MKKLVYNFLMPLIGIAVIIVNVSDVKKSITEYLGEYGPTIITAFLIAASLMNHFLTYRTPYKELQERNKERWEKFTHTALESIKTIKMNSGIDVSFNVMKPRRKLFCIQPGRIVFFPLVFDVVWECGRNHVNKRLKITTKQGACGMAYEQEDFFSFDLEKMKAANHNFEKEFNFTSAQVRLTDKITMVASCPIILRETLPDRQRIKVVGVLSVESRMLNSGILIDDETKKAAIYSVMETLTDMVAVI